MQSLPFSSPDDRQRAAAKSYQRELVTEDLCRELLPLFRRHYAEIARFQDIPLEPDFAAYLEQERAGRIRLFTAREKNWDLVGYALFIVGASAHYRSSGQATEDLLFIRPESRGFGFEFCRWCDEQLRREGIQLVYRHTTVKRDHSLLFRRLGYEQLQSTYVRRLN